MIKFNQLNSRQQQILRFLLYSEQPITMEQLASKTAISRAAIGKHMDLLISFKLVASQLQDSTGGRPSRAFELTDAGRAIFPKQYHLFSRALLSAISQKLDDDSITEILTEMGAQLATQLEHQLNDGQDKMMAVRKIMANLGYETVQPTDEAGEQSLIAKNCVFHDLAINDERVCQLDISLISNLLGEPVYLKECMAKGGKHCHFCKLK
ncbi:MAG: HTH domain-containing protein [Proteobacteria bacterium]|nr:MAG: HTH domain-containing protein [Pseudomonadota bacterium]